jgi:lipoate-protein ligase A
MAVDKFLFDNFKKNSMPILRVYEWRDSFTLGVSQNIDDIKDNQNIEFAKRFTGGGKLKHGHDISYSLVIPSKILDSNGVKKSYEELCSFLILFYKDLSLSVEYAKDNRDIKLSKSPLCEAGFEPYDIVCGMKKLGGNAQRRTKDLIFQHGSIPVLKNRGNSLEDFGISITKDEAKNRLIKAFSDTFSVDFDDLKLTSNELLSIKEITNDNQK